MVVPIHGNASPKLDPSRASGPTFPAPRIASPRTAPKNQRWTINSCRRSWLGSAAYVSFIRPVGASVLIKSWRRATVNFLINYTRNTFDKFVNWWTNWRNLNQYNPKQNQRRIRGAVPPNRLSGSFLAIAATGRFNITPKTEIPNQRVLRPE